MNKPVEDFFNPGLKISKATGLSNAAVSKNLNKYQPYLDEQRFMSNLRNDAVQTKITGKGLTLGEFYDHMQNRILVYEEAGKEMGKMGTIERRILEDAWRHTQQGGTKFEWVKKPGLDPSGNVTRWGEAKFRYKGKGSSGKLWNVDTLNINASEAPEFKEYFRVGKERNKLLNEIVTHPVSGKEVKFGQLMKEVYNIGSGQKYNVMGYQVDHLDLLNDPLGLDPKKGLRILPARINSAGGQVKKNINKYKYKIGKPETYIKYSPANSAQAYEKMGYNYTKNPNQILNDEYNFAKKTFNKFQAAGWRWNPQNNTWDIKPGFEKGANAAKGNIIRRPAQIVEAVRAGNTNALGIVEKSVPKTIRGTTGVTLGSGLGVLDDLIKRPGAKKAIRGAGWLLGPIDLVLEPGMALPALARGNPQMARRSTTPGVFGSYGGTMLEDIRKYNRGAYRYAKAMKDVNEWNALEEDIQRANKVISGEIGGYPGVAQIDLAEAKKKQALLEKNYREIKETDFQAFQDTMTQMAKDSREWSGDKNWLGQERGEQVTQESLEAEGVKPIDAYMMMKNADTTDEWRKRHQLEELDYELGGLDVETFLDPYGLKVQDPRYSDLPTDIASDYGKWEADQARQKLEQLQNIDPGAAFAGGGIASIRRPWAIPPESGPDPQGLASLNNYATKRTE